MFYAVSTVFRSYHGDTSHYSFISWVSPILGCGSEVPCLMKLSRKKQRIQCCLDPGPLDYESNPLLLNHAGPLYFLRRFTGFTDILESTALHYCSDPLKASPKFNPLVSNDLTSKFTFTQCLNNLFPSSYSVFLRDVNWRGHQTFPTVVSLKGRLPQKLQSKSTLSCEILQIHSLFRHDFINKPKSHFNRNRKYTNLFLCEAFRKTDHDMDLIADAFRGSIQNIRLCLIFFSFIFCSIIYLFEKRKSFLF